MSRIQVSNDELVTVRQAMRTLHRLLARLDAGEVDHFVLMHRNRMVARIVPIGREDDASEETPA